MSTFDAQAFVEAILQPVRDLLLVNFDVVNDISYEFRELAQDIEATLAALEVECDFRRARALRDDLEKFLPTRKATLLSKLPVGHKDQVEIEKSLDLAIFGTIAVAKAFVIDGKWR